MQSRCCILFICLSFIFNIYSWNSFGHMLATQITENTLNATNPQLYTKFSNMVLALNNLTFGHSQTFVQASPWASELESRGFTFLNNWHFSNVVLNASNPPNAANQPQLKLELSEEDLSYGLQNCQTVLTNKNLKSVIYFENAMMARYAVHLSEDAHQPLHCATLYSTSYPYGDLQGTLYNVTVPTMNYTGTLYDVWNSGLLQFPQFILPLSQDNITYIQTMAQNLTAKYPQTYFGTKVQNANWNDWISESHLVAWQSVYQPLLNSSNPNVITQSYINAAYPIVEQQITLAGYRLAYWIQQMFNSTASVYL